LLCQAIVVNMRDLGCADAVSTVGVSGDPFSCVIFCRKKNP